MKLTTRLHLVLRSRMHGTILPLPQYVFMAWFLVSPGMEVSSQLQNLAALLLEKELPVTIRKEARLGPELTR
jgi:hypothetical protein